MLAQGRLGLLARISARFESALPRNSMRRVVVSFALLVAVLVPAVELSASWSGWQRVTGALAVVTGVLARALGMDVVVTEKFVAVPSRVLSVDWACSPIMISTVYAALVLAYPLRWRLRLAALAIGLPVLALANVARLLATTYASEHLPDASFDMVHQQLGVMTTFVAIGLWAVWLSIARRAT